MIIETATVTAIATWVWGQVVNGNATKAFSSIVNTYQVFKDFLQRHEKVEFTQDEFTPLLEKILHENEQLRQDLEKLMPTQPASQTFGVFNNNSGTISNSGTIQINAPHNNYK